MKKTVKLSVVNGEVSAPASKSMAQRAIAIASLCKGKTVLTNYTSCEDSEAALENIQKLGARVEKRGNILEITGGGKILSHVLHCGEAGLGIRMFTPIVAALSRHPVTLTGKGSLLNRPVDMMEKPLITLGAKVTTRNGYIPITVKGPITGGSVVIDGSSSSQFLTGLLIALPLAQKDSIIEVKNLKSKPYIDMTLEIIQHFGVSIQHDNYEHFYIKSNQEYKSGEYSIEGDWSGASFLLVAGAITGNISVNNLRIPSLQADYAILDALRKANANIIINDNRVTVKKSELRPFTFDATDCPDLFPPLAVLAAYAPGVSVIKGISRLLHKESNRAETIKKEFHKIGVAIELLDDTMYIHGGNIKGADVFSHNDHRIAMAMTIAALGAVGNMIIDNAECLNKSFPEFYKIIESVGANIE